MVNNQQNLDDIFHALSDATRRAMLARLAEGECNVTELAAPFQMSLAAVSKHLKVLEKANLVRKEKNGRTYRCRPHFEPLSEANVLLEKFAVFWNDKLSALEKFLIDDSKNNGEKHDNSSSSTNRTKVSNQKSASGKKRKGL